jgi:starvation-inducible outer membrane lipoprotein
MMKKINFFAGLAFMVMISACSTKTETITETETTTPTQTKTESVPEPEPAKIQSKETTTTTTISTKKDENGTTLEVDQNGVSFGKKDGEKETSIKVSNDSTKIQLKLKR